MKKQDKVKQGKKSKAAGNRFEKRVREDLEKKGWIVDRWTNNVEFEIPDYPKEIPPIYADTGERDKCRANITKEKMGKLVPAKPKFVYNPKLKRRIPIGMSSGFPDFICFRILPLLFSKETYDNLVKVTNGECPHLYKVIGIECKSNGILTKEEKEKCRWLLENNIFSKIIIAKKGKKRGEIEYMDFIE